MTDAEAIRKLTTATLFLLVLAGIAFVLRYRSRQGVSTISWRGFAKKPIEHVVNYESHRLDATTRLMVVQFKGTEYRLLQANGSVLLLDNVSVAIQPASSE